MFFLLCVDPREKSNLCLLFQCEGIATSAERLIYKDLALVSLSKCFCSFFFFSLQRIEGIQCLPFFGYLNTSVVWDGEV